MKHGPYNLVSSTEIYKNQWINVKEDKIRRPNGQDGLYGVVTYSPGVATVALSDKMEVFLVKEYLYATDVHGICLPGGGVEHGESILEAAKKELREEAGVEASDWIELGCVEPNPMLIDGPQFLFLAKGARKVTDHEEEFTLLSVSFEEAINMVMRGEIKHAASCVAILKAKYYLE